MRRIFRAIACTLLLAFSFLISSCVTVKETLTKEPFLYTADQTEEEMNEGSEQNGSIWRENEGLFADRRAGSVNDIITVKIVESSKATRKASTSTGRTSEMEGGIDALLGLDGGFGSHRFNPQSMIGLRGDKSFNGTGSTERSGALTGVITAIVKEVYPNGMMRIEGRRVVTVNAEDQYITISGLVRRDDIAIDNTIFSAKVADAVIEYSGEGIIGREQRPGWLTRALDVVWPF